MSTSDTLDRAPEQIEAEISASRQSLDRKLHELEKRFSPRYRWAELQSAVREKLDAPPVAAWGAVVAVAAGSWMAVSGLRRHRMKPDGEEPGPDMAVTGITVCE